MDEGNRSGQWLWTLCAAKKLRTSTSKACRGNRSCNTTEPLATVAATNLETEAIKPSAHVCKETKSTSGRLRMTKPKAKCNRKKWGASQSKATIPDYLEPIEVTDGRVGLPFDLLYDQTPYSYLPKFYARTFKYSAYFNPRQRNGDGKFAPDARLAIRNKTNMAHWKKYF